MNSSRTAVRRWQVVGVGAVAVALVGVGLGVASAEESVPTVNCPAVAGSLGAVPAQAQAEIQRNLALLNTQISEANNRLRTTVGQGGPNFIQNAILGPLKDKRVATINRMATAIGRNAAKPNLNVNGLATCSLNQNGGGNAAPEPTVVKTAAAGSGNSAGGAVPTVNCPAVAGSLGAVPAQAQAEIQRNLALLNTQISEANNRLRTSVGQGGANFIQNAILGPLKDKRVATINRMATAIGRNAARPNLNVNALATCSLNQNGGGNAAPEPTAVPTAGNGNANNGNAGNNNAGNNNAGNGNVPTVNCPAVTGLPAIPAQAAAEVQRNLQQLDTQIAEANARIASTVGQGGPNFIQNAILGPLEDKRTAALNRIETAIGRVAAKPEGLERFAPCSLNQ
jgi:F0F1-type ATP synthase membrane subunit b/b'